MGYTPPRPPAKIRVLGRNATGAFNHAAHTMHQAGYATEHDKTIAKKLAWVLTGGDVLSNTEVDEAHLLDLGREAFLSLCGMPKTQARMIHMLKTGKPLRN